MTNENIKEIFPKEVLQLEYALRDWRMTYFNFLVRKNMFLTVRQENFAWRHLLDRHNEIIMEYSR